MQARQTQMPRSPGWTAVGALAAAAFFEGASRGLFQSLEKGLAL